MKRWTLALALLAAGAWLGLSAREEKAEDELAMVPASARMFYTTRPADAWDSDLGKEIRKALAKEFAEGVKHLKAEIGVGPEAVERATVFVTAFQPRENVGFLVRFTEKVDDAILAKLAPGGRPEKINGVDVVASEGSAAFLKGGKILGFGAPAAVKAMLGNMEKRSPSLVAALKRAGGKHSLVAYVEPGLFPVKADAIPLPGAFLKPFLAADSAIGWADLGATLKVAARVTFANEASAGRGHKAVEAARKIGIAALATLSDELSKGPKELVEMAALGEKSLEKATIKKDGEAVEASLEVTVGKAPLIAMLKQATDKMRVASSRMRSANNLKQIGLALHNYHDAHGAMPPQAVYDKDGKALLSWRVLILPYIEQDVLYKKFKLDEPWDSAHNKKLLAQVPPIFAAIDGKNTVPHGTFYQVFHGKGAMFEGKRGTKFAGITDGLSNTLMVVEAAKDVPWSKPDDVPFDADKAVPKLGAFFEDGFNALFGDGAVRFLQRKLKADTLKAYITRNGGEVIDLP